jgi:hypothetical protein
MKKTPLFIISLSIITFCFVVPFNQNSSQSTQKPNTQTEFYEEDSNEQVDGGGGSIKERSSEVVEYFNEIALNNEFDGSRSSAYTWKTDMKIYVDGERPEYLMTELQKIVGELNDIIDPINIKIVSSPNQANYTIFVGSHTDFQDKYDLDNPERLNRNWGYFEVFGNSGVMYIDTYRNGDETSHKHLLREELTQSLGLFNDSWEYPESIFYQGWTTTTEFAPIDRELIDMLYNN